MSGRYLSMLADAPAEKAYKAEKAPLNTLNPLNTQSGTQEELHSILGNDYAEIAKRPHQLAAFAHAQECRKMRMQGIAPRHYVSTATCRFCGSVPAPPGFEVGTLGSCWWCANRHAGLPIPRPR